ncbi:tRNA (adenosine(37)-N6)-dimethylallyltransferase MiaA [Capnocytophaga stomatis]|uniref:tRNA dimethylallyltransferase n=1 Tax=Capnocytophaga stomatis TaxID=1848904 RepID=A0A250G215_9FLAO|nr:tRNA (adenosine(37)-N6)-dimethylallyltransferase MiaA [Capnocytophaga stomatis]ATA90368.1 tRNA (adenosine(37)-N6)-dimethylallyltransferase MiaA [Capnocytophaga stomatis]GIJ97095.1 tRNA dimethylallyltransferase [Capnocytophaga stomatis]GIM49570.1 tRNA dimethylallyltransferase [Capnocytophaga stomatis]
MIEEHNNLLITVVGPTAIGKTRLAIELAKQFDTEIISCDSRQFFKEMRIGTAVPEPSELEAVKHHFIQHKSIFDSYSVGDFERDAIQLLEELFENRKVVVMVGGSGLYADAVIKGLDEFPEVPEEVRAELNQKYLQKGIEYLQEELKKLDFVQYSRMDIQNPQRLIRALEVCLASGKPYSSFLNRKETKRNFSHIEIGLTAERDIVYQRINQRVEQMLEQGLLCEVQELIPYKNLNALQTVGYRELFQFFEGKYSLDFAIEEIKKNTRRFAKRQYTWFGKNENIKWFDYQCNISDVLKQINFNRSD